MTDRLLKQASLSTAHVPLAGNTASLGKIRFNFSFAAVNSPSESSERNARHQQLDLSSSPTSRATQQQVCRISCRPQSRRATRSRRRLDRVIDHSLHLVSAGSDRANGEGDSDGDTTNLSARPDKRTNNNHHHNDNPLRLSHRPPLLADNKTHPPQTNKINPPAIRPRHPPPPTLLLSHPLGRQRRR